MVKLLKIEKKPTCDEYIVWGNGGCIGQIHKGMIFRRRIVLRPEEDTEWTAECLREVADKLDALNAMRSRKS